MFTSYKAMYNSIDDIKKIIDKRDISNIEEKVIKLYGKGLSTHEISDSIEDIYNIQLSAR